jgi:hypothetical protein
MSAVALLKISKYVAVLALGAGIGLGVGYNQSHKAYELGWEAGAVGQYEMGKLCVADVPDENHLVDLDRWDDCMDARTGSDTEISKIQGRGIPTEFSFLGLEPQNKY